MSIDYQELKSYLSNNPWAIPPSTDMLAKASQNEIPYNERSRQLNDGYYFTSLGKLFTTQGNIAKIGDVKSNETVYVIIEDDNYPLTTDNMNSWFAASPEPVKLFKNYSELIELSAMIYGEASENTDKNEMYALGTAHINDPNQKAFAVGERRYEIFKKEYKPEIRKIFPRIDLQTAMCASLNASLYEIKNTDAIDLSNGARFWEGRDFILKVSEEDRKKGKGNNGHKEIKGMYVSPENKHYWEEYCARVHEAWAKRHIRLSRKKDFWEKNMFQDRKFVPLADAAFEVVVSYGESIFFKRGPKW